MASSDASVRHRKPEPKATKDSSSAASEPMESGSEKKQKPSKRSSKKVAPKDRADDDDDYSRGTLLLDIFRVVTFLFLVSCGLSYLISGGETFFWGMSDPPKYMKLDWWKRQFRAPIYLTASELAAYDGTDPTKPIYLAINWTIYDVSSNPRTYGPGGSYHYFAGCDAARAYVTGCFAEDRTPDMRGVEEMFMPLDDPTVDRHWSKAELAQMKAKEREEAERKVHEGLLHWVNFFKNSDKYDFVGYVKRPEGWPGTEPVRRLCDTAAKQRKVRSIPDKEGKK
ncbi:Membrane-associated progesterone-binding protein 4 [Madurella mycetomatis]|uniref:Membrane-associated progesterone-binding protein 4 n=1 Tax=Madurella mycetomatis TaxID=100816 RepID=A0A175W8U2_9PEZI|nr:Membrane-associated progesterone-binding protein 4 [Madurella mycetomatis]